MKHIRQNSAAPVQAGHQITGDKLQPMLFHRLQQDARLLVCYNEVLCSGVALHTCV